MHGDRDLRTAAAVEEAFAVQRLQMLDGRRRLEGQQVENRVGVLPEFFHECTEPPVAVVFVDRFIDAPRVCTSADLMTVWCIHKGGLNQ